MTIVIDRSMSSKEIRKKISQLDSKAKLKDEKKFEEQRRKCRQAFGKAFLDVDDPVALQREWRDD